MNPDLKNLQDGGTGRWKGEEYDYLRHYASRLYYVSNDEVYPVCEVYMTDAYILFENAAELFEVAQEALELLRESDHTRPTVQRLQEVLGKIERTEGR